jgi:hypothetical protein
MFEQINETSDGTLDNSSMPVNASYGLAYELHRAKWGLSQ